MKFSASLMNMPKAEFVATFGGVYEHSPWIAEQAWEQGLSVSHDNPGALAELMSNIVNTATKGQQLDLILAHPDLAGKAAQAGELTTESSNEQSGAGINLCNAKEFKQFQDFNQAYRAKFNFPFIMAVKGANRHKILSAFKHRLPNDYEPEFKQALLQIHKIARFRLEDIAQDTAAGKS
ncbi:MAG: 2-oxo-4-hydroxy-4-carboxy-5-ureidoimidazoline decarboxylase [Proteobacteria bacterium]|nr:2-oxo-4-hydroxy-4-carboxy-5-ureidoimidazoline decarboxylase [Pseudomonadota bacterium]